MYDVQVMPTGAVSCTTPLVGLEAVLLVMAAALQDNTMNEARKC